MRSSVIFWLLIAACSLFGMGIVLAITSQGVATWVDSAHYIAAARSLLGGGDLRMCYGSPFTRFPPLFPMVTASLMAGGAAPLDAIRLINTLAFGLIIFLSGWLMRFTLESRVLAVLGTLAVVFSWPQVLWAIHALSETLFTLLILWFIVQLWLYLQKPTPFRFVLLIVVAALAPLQRYAGVAVLGVGVICLLGYLHEPIRRRIVKSVVFGICAALPLGLWILRNYALSGLWFGPHGQTQTWGIEYLSYLANPMLDWLVPPRIGQSWTITGTAAGDLAGIIILICVPLILYRRQNQAKADPTRLNAGILVGIFCVIYFFVLQLAAPSVPILGQVARFTAPMYPAFMLVILFSLDRLAGWLNGLVHRPLGSLVVAVCVGAWLFLPAAKLVREVNGLTRSDGWTGFSERTLQDSPLVTWENPDQIVDPVYSNKPMPLCVRHDMFVQTLPPDDSAGAEQRLLSSDADTLTVIILPDSDRYAISYSVDAFSDAFDIEPLLETDEGGIYRLTRRGSS